VTTREKLHRLVDELNKAEVEAALIRLEREHEAVQQWAQREDAEAVEDAWAQGNAREAIRQEPW
jgi:transcriptional regulator of NAD metabolism